MQSDVKHVRFPGKLVMVGFGSIGQAMLPLLFRHIDITPERKEIAREFGVEFTLHCLTEADYRGVLEPCLDEGDFLLNLSVDVASLALIKMCWRRGALYLDTCIEPWAGGYSDPSLPMSHRSNYALREGVLAFRLDKRAGPTAVLTQGANPGLASIFVKQALLDLAADNNVAVVKPASYEDWAELARRLQIRAIHIAERDTQTSERRKQRDEFVNTWSVVGFVAESLQPCELGWGSHERHWPADAERHGFGCDAAIYLKRPGAVEPDDIDYETVLEIARPYLGELVGAYGEWTPLRDRSPLFSDAVDEEDPWQFKNFRVI